MFVGNAFGLLELRLCPLPIFITLHHLRCLLPFTVLDLLLPPINHAVLAQLRVQQFWYPSSALLLLLYGHRVQLRKGWSLWKCIVRFAGWSSLHSSISDAFPLCRASAAGRWHARTILSSVYQTQNGAALYRVLNMGNFQGFMTGLNFSFAAVLRCVQWQLWCRSAQ